MTASAQFHPTRRTFSKRTLSINFGISKIHGLRPSLIPDPSLGYIQLKAGGLIMADISDVVLAQNRTTLLLRAFLKIFLIYFVASLVIGLSVVGYLYFTVRNLSSCALTDPSGNCSTSSIPQFCEYIIAIFGIGSIIQTFFTASKALNETLPEDDQD